MLLQEVQKENQNESLEPQLLISAMITINMNQNEVARVFKGCLNYHYYHFIIFKAQKTKCI